MIYKPAYDVNFIIVKFLENWNNKEKHINFRSLLGKIKKKKRFLKKVPVERRRRLSRCHGSKISRGSQQTVVLADRKNENVDMYDFPLHDCTQEQNGSSFDNANGLRCQRKIVDIQKFCCHGNVT